MQVLNINGYNTLPSSERQMYFKKLVKVKNEGNNNKKAEFYLHEDFINISTTLKFIRIFQWYKYSQGQRSHSTYFNFRIFLAVANQA